MKKNTFKYTFYFGLLIILGLTILLTAISFNIYKSVVNKMSTTKEEEHVVEVPFTPEKEIVHDTIYFERPQKQVDTPKQKKGSIPSVKVLTEDTSHVNDSIIK